MNTNNPFNDTIENLKKATDSVDKITRENNKNEEKKTDKLNKRKDQEDDSNQNDENNDPAYILYNAISNSAIETLKSDAVINTFKKLSPVLGEDVSKSIIEMFAILLTQSAYQAVLFYDDLLKQELSMQFNHMGEHLNIAKADIEAHNGVLKVFRQQLGEIQKKLNIDKIEEEYHITPDPNK